MLFENENVVVEENETSTPNDTGNETASTVGSEQVGETKPEVNPTSENEIKTFTQEMVDEIVRSRLDRDRKATYNRYGVEDKEGLDELISKGQSYDEIKERLELLNSENASLKEKMAFLSNNINPAREDDIRAYFKGKEIEFNETNLIEELETHPEWLKVKEVNTAPQTTITSLGVEHRPINRGETEDERRKRIFGI